MHARLKVWSVGVVMSVGGLSDSCWGQLAAVRVNNYWSEKPICYLEKGGTSGPETTRVTLLGGPLDGALAPVEVAQWGGAIPLTEWNETYGGGFFDGNVGVVQGVPPGGLARFQLLAWVGPEAYDLAAFRGASQVWTQATGSWSGAITNPPIAAVELSIPESVIITPSSSTSGYVIPRVALEKGGGATVVLSWVVGSQTTELCSVAELGAGANPRVLQSDVGLSAGTIMSATVPSSQGRRFFYLRKRL